MLLKIVSFCLNAKVQLLQIIVLEWNVRNICKYAFDYWLFLDWDGEMLIFITCTIYQHLATFLDVFELVLLKA